MIQAGRGGTWNLSSWPVFRRFSAWKSHISTCRHSFLHSFIHGSLSAETARFSRGDVLPRRFLCLWFVNWKTSFKQADFHHDPHGKFSCLTWLFSAPRFGDGIGGGSRELDDRNRDVWFVCWKQLPTSRLPLHPARNMCCRGRRCRLRTMICNGLHSS